MNAQHGSVDAPKPMRILSIDGGGIRGVLAVSVTPAPSTAPSSTHTPSTTMQRDPMKQWSSTMTGRAGKSPVIALTKATMFEPPPDIRIATRFTSSDGRGNARLGLL